MDPVKAIREIFEREYGAEAGDAFARAIQPGWIEPEDLFAAMAPARPAGVEYLTEAPRPTPPKVFHDYSVCPACNSEDGECPKGDAAREAKRVATDMHRVATLAWLAEEEAAWAWLFSRKMMIGRGVA